MELSNGKRESEEKFGEHIRRPLWNAEKWNGKALAASWDSSKLVGQWVLLTKLEPGEVEVPCDMLGAVAHMTDPSWDSGVFSQDTSWRRADPGEGKTVCLSTCSHDVCLPAPNNSSNLERSTRQHGKGPGVHIRTVKVTAQVSQG